MIPFKQLWFSPKENPLKSFILDRLELQKETVAITGEDLSDSEDLQEDRS